MAWSQEEFTNWKASPLTQKFFAFLGDKREDLKETWAQGIDMSKEDEAVAFVYGDILDLKYGHISEFYETEEEESEDE
jgi:2-phospho-L-lactate guanylyltransferase (CobY/MobA/RfbA family)|tara:strand:+ start:6435 stop:6668 length:234 start_codon:yes stop_codon:yes gene_type:complete